MKIDPYYQRRKCSAETLVCRDLRVVPIFVAGYGASKESGVV